MEEASARLEIPTGTVKSRVARARARLKALAEDRDAPRPAQQATTAKPERKATRRDWKGVVIG